MTRRLVAGVSAAVLALGILAAVAAPAPADDTVKWLLPSQYKDRVVATKKGRVVVVNLWATWCEPCREEMPALVAATKRFKTKDVALVLVSLDSKKSGPAAVPKFLAALKIPYPSWLVKANDPEEFIGVPDKNWDGSIPYTLIHDRQGRVYVRLLGKQTEDQFAEAIKRALSPP